MFMVAMALLPTDTFTTSLLALAAQVWLHEIVVFDKTAVPALTASTVGMAYVTSSTMPSARPSLPRTIFLLRGLVMASMIAVSV